MRWKLRVREGLRVLPAPVTLQVQIRGLQLVCLVCLATGAGSDSPRVVLPSPMSTEGAGSDEDLSGTWSDGPTKET